jgi:hypothetical protein
MAARRRTKDRTIHRPVQAGATVPEKDCGRPDRLVPPDVAPPHAGRTGGLGARAERPSEGSLRKSDDKLQQTGRGGKAPSAQDGADDE